MFFIENPPLMCFRTEMWRVRIGLALLAGTIVCGVASAATCDTAKAPVVPVVKGLPYKEARQSILSSGWQSTVGHPHNDLSSNESTFRDRGWGELQFCRLTADSPCRFKFAGANGTVLWITTTGEENNALGTQATVKAAKLACSDEPDPG
jgi:hypothetical protein